MISDSQTLANTAGFEIVASDQGRDIESGLRLALAGGTVFPSGTTPLSVFRHTLADSIRNIESHPRGRLFQKFLLKGPYEDVGDIPAQLASDHLSDYETASAITFIYSHMVNYFKGSVTELLAANACMRLMKQLQQHGELPVHARLYVGDAVLGYRESGRGRVKGADLHILIGEQSAGPASRVAVAGVAEVKSYIRSASPLREQINQHLRRAMRGLQVGGVDYPADKVTVGWGKGRRVVSVTVLPSDWKLPRSFRYEDTETGRVLHVDPRVPPRQDDDIARTAEDQWRITLRWSKEALAEAAYEMTFWYMAKVGEIIYSNSVPKGWEKMTRAEAGRNAAKMMLYYAILRCRTAR